MTPQPKPPSLTPEQIASEIIDAWIPTAFHPRTVYPCELRASIKALVQRKHDEMDELRTEIQTERDRAEKAEAEMKQLAAHYGVSILHERCLKAEHELAEAVEALKPFAEQADYMATRTDDASLCFALNLDLEVRHCRRAAEIVAKQEKK